MLTLRITYLEERLKIKFNKALIEQYVCQTLQDY